MENELKSLTDSVKNLAFKSSNPLGELREKAKQIFDIVNKATGRPHNFLPNVRVVLAKIENSEGRTRETFNKYKKELLKAVESIV